MVTWDGLVVAIDGPSGTGKSSISRAVARRLGAAYLDTGAMYRALTWAVLRDGVERTDAAAVSAYAAAARIEVRMDPDDPGISVDDVDVRGPIRQDRVTEAVSSVATNLDVRAVMRRRQRELIGVGLAHRGAIVVEGRDITTVIAPEAAVRILLTADEQARLARRARQLTGRDDAQARSAQRDKVIARDAADSTVSEFTTAADGVVTIDSSEMSFEQTLEAVLAVVAAQAGGPGRSVQVPGD